MADSYGFHVGKYTVRPMDPMGPMFLFASERLYQLSTFLLGLLGLPPLLVGSLRMVVSKSGISKLPGGPYFQGLCHC